MVICIVTHKAHCKNGNRSLNRHGYILGRDGNAQTIPWIEPQTGMGCFVHAGTGSGFDKPTCKMSIVTSILYIIRDLKDVTKRIEEWYQAGVAGAGGDEAKDNWLSNHVVGAITVHGVSSVEVGEARRVTGILSHQIHDYLSHRHCSKSPGSWLLI